MGQSCAERGCQPRPAGGVEACLPPGRAPSRDSPAAGSAWEPLCSVAAPLGVTLLGRGQGL